MLSSPPGVSICKRQYQSPEPLSVDRRYRNSKSDNIRRVVCDPLGSGYWETGATVVSGLAIGCDTAAHSGCLSVHGETIAVLAHGLDRVYPAVNRELVGEILDTGGCLLSEYPPKTRPFPANFVERDELQAGLSDGVIVVETGVKGGTMHTVRFSQEQRKPLACVKHPQNSLQIRRLSATPC